MSLADTIADRIEAGTATAEDLALAARAVRAAGTGRPVLSLLAAEARARRDDLLLDLWRLRYADRSSHGAAQAISIALGRYEATTWRHDRLRTAVPAVHHLEFEILCCGPSPAWRTIFDVLQRPPARLQSDPNTMAP